MRSRCEVENMRKQRPYKDLTGQTFGRLTVTGRGPDYVNQDGFKQIQWLCDCSCGTKGAIVLGTNLKRGKTVSCGCYRREKSRETIARLRAAGKFKGGPKKWQS